MTRPLQSVLYIDDDEELLDIVQICLEEIAGYQVTTCANSDEGVRLAQDRHPDLIMLDVMMPGTDGPATLKRLRENIALDDIPVIFMTARNSAAQLEGYRQLGVAGTLDKPFDAIALAGHVAALWDQL